MMALRALRPYPYISSSRHGAGQLSRRPPTLGNVAHNPLWLLVPWAVFALAAAAKFWLVTTLFRRHMLGFLTRTERFRQTLERIWQKDQQAA